MMNSSESAQAASVDEAPVKEAPIEEASVEEVPAKETDAESISRSSASSSSQKRKVSKSESSPSGTRHRKLKLTPICHHHETHWEDGDVYVRSGTIRFKLHRSRLARLSVWFREIFEENATADARAAIEIVLDKMDVSAGDFAALMDALDNSIKYTYTQPTFQEVAPILRAATTLCFESFIPWGRQYLESMWPSNVELVAPTRIPFATETVVLARRCRIRTVLKRSLYELVRMKGFGQRHAPNDGEEVGCSATLSAADHIMLTKTREKLGSRWIEVALSLQRDVDSLVDQSTCSDVDQEVKVEGSDDGIQTSKPRSLCANAQCPFARLDSAYRIHRKLVHDSGIFASYIWDPICGIQALLEAPWADAGCCVDCVDQMRSEGRRQKEQIWNDLDIWFELIGKV